MIKKTILLLSLLGSFSFAGGPTPVINLQLENNANAKGYTITNLANSVIPSAAATVGQLNNATNNLQSQINNIVVGGGLTSNQVESIAGSVVSTSIIARATTVTGAQSNKINTALQPNDTNGWVVSSHAGFITSNDVPAQTTQVFVAMAGVVVGSQSNKIDAALTNASDFATAQQGISATNAQYRVVVLETNAVTKADTNGWVVSSHSSFVDQTVTNGLASIAYVNTVANSTTNRIEDATNALWIAVTNVNSGINAQVDSNTSFRINSTVNYATNAGNAATVGGYTATQLLSQAGVVYYVWGSLAGPFAGSKMAQIESPYLVGVWTSTVNNVTNNMPLGYASINTNELPRFTVMGAETVHISIERNGNSQRRRMKVCKSVYESDGVTLVSHICGDNIVIPQGKNHLDFTLFEVAETSITDNKRFIVYNFWTVDGWNGSETIKVYSQDGELTYITTAGGAGVYASRNELNTHTALTLAEDVHGGRSTAIAATNAQYRVGILETNVVTKADTNGWVVSSHASFVDATITNGLASVSYVNSVAVGLTNRIVDATNNLWAASTNLVNGYVPTNRTITVNGQSGTLSSNLNFSVVGTSTSEVQAIIREVNSTGTILRATTVIGSQSNIISSAVTNNGSSILGYPLTNGSTINFPVEVWSNPATINNTLVSLAQVTNAVNNINNGIFWVTNTFVVSNSANISIPLPYNRVKLDDVRVFISYTNSGSFSKRGQIQIFRKPTRRCADRVYLWTNALFYAAISTVAQPIGSSTNVIADASGIVGIDLYYQLGANGTNDFITYTNNTSTVLYQGCTNEMVMPVGSLISHVEQFGGFPYYDATGNSNLYVTIPFYTAWTSQITTVVNGAQL